MAYIGTAPNIGENRKLDDISGSFNGSTTTFDLKVATAYVYPGVATSLLISVGGILQEPGSAYTLHSNGKQITFTTAPGAGADFFGVVLGASIDIGTPAADSVTTAKIADGAVTAIKLADALGFANVAGNVSIGRSLAVGYTDGRVPQANLDVKNNVYIGGATTIGGAATLSSTATVTGKLSATSVTPAFYGANIAGNASVARSLAVGYVDHRVPQANLDVRSNVHVAGTIPTLTLHDDSGTSYTNGANVAMLQFQGRSSGTRTGAAIRAIHDSTNGTLYGLSFDTRISDTQVESMRIENNTITLFDNILTRANLKDYGEVTSALGSAGGARTIDLEDGNSFSATVSASTVTWTFSNPTASDELCGFTLTLVNGGSQTVNWPGSVDWGGGSAPSLTTSGTDVLVFFTIDGGTIWHGMIASTDSK